MKKILNDFFNNNNIQYQNKTFVLAVSTGVDSSVMLDTFIQFKNELNIVVAHCNHHKRSQSEEEENYIKAYCEKLGIKCFVEELFFKDIKDNFQALAREKRYNFFRKVMEEVDGDYLVLAHHGDDLLETVLMRITRGSSLAGYAGINAVVDFYNGQIIRPFLMLSKSDIREYAISNKIIFYDDESNDSDVYTRNRLRHDIIPLLKQECPNIIKKISEYSKTIKEASIVCNSVRDDFIHKFIKKGNNKIEFNKNDFLKLSSYLQEEVLFELLKIDNLSKASIYELLKLIRGKKVNFETNYKNKFIILISYDIITINHNLNVLNNINKTYLEVNKCGTFICNDNFKLSVSKIVDKNVTNLNELWYNIDNLPITIRSRQDGDKIKLKNGYKKIKDILIDLKIPKAQRDKILLGCDQNGEVLIIFGIRKSEILKEQREINIVIKLEENKNG